MVGFEAKIKELCKRNSTTQKQLYEAIGVTDAGMRKMYARNSCEVALLEKIADYFGVPVMDFFTIEKPAISDVHNSVVNGYTINDGATINRLIALLEEKDKQIARLLKIIESK
jgi:DNA-binding XRE family transcriptional regulator